MARDDQLREIESLALGFGQIFVAGSLRQVRAAGQKPEILSVRRAQRTRTWKHVKTHLNYPVFQAVGEFETWMPDPARPLVGIAAAKLSHQGGLPLNVCSHGDQNRSGHADHLHGQMVLTCLSTFLFSEVRLPTATA